MQNSRSYARKKIGNRRTRISNVNPESEEEASGREQGKKGENKVGKKLSLPARFTHAASI